MSVTPAEPTTEPTTEPPVATATPEAPKPTEPPKAPEPAANPWEDPKAAQAEIERLRRENGAARTNAKQAAADEARAELARSIGEILNPGSAEALDPAKLTESLTTSQAEAKQARVELAVFRAAGAVNGDPAALLDSTSFLKSLADVDPSDSAAVQAAITKAVTDNPRLGVAPNEPRTPAPNPAQGTSASGAPGFDSQIAEATKAGNHLLAISLKQQRAAALAAKKS